MARSTIAHEPRNHVRRRYPKRCSSNVRPIASVEHQRGFSIMQIEGVEPAIVTPSLPLNSIIARHTRTNQCTRENIASRALRV